MANVKRKKYGEHDIVFNVVTNVKEAEQELTSFAKQVEKTEEKNGMLHLKATIDDKNFINFDKFIEKYNAKGSNSLQITFDNKATLASLGKTEESIKAGLERITTLVNNFVNLNKMVNGSVLNLDLNSPNIFNEIEKRVKAIDKIGKSEEANLKQRVQRMQKLYSAAYDSAIQPKGTTDYLYILQKRLNDFGLLKELKKQGFGVDANKNKITQKNITDILSKEIPDKDMETLAAFNRSFKDLEYALNIDGTSLVDLDRYGKQLRKLKSDIENGFLNEVNLDRILNADNVDDKLLNQVNKAVDDVKKKVGDNPAIVFNDVQVGLEVTVDELLKLHDKITKHLQDIKIGLDVDDTEIEKITSKIEGKSSQAGDSLNANKEAFDKYYKKYMHKTKQDSLDRAYKIIDEALANNVKSLDEQTLRELAATGAAYSRKSGNNFTLKNLLKKKKSISDPEKFFGNFQEIYEEFEQYLSNVENGIKVGVILEPKGVDGQTLRQQVQSDLDGLSISIKQVDGLEAATYQAANQWVETMTNRLQKRLEQEKLIKPELKAEKQKDTVKTNKVETSSVKPQVQTEESLQKTTEALERKIKEQRNILAKIKTDAEAGKFDATINLGIKFTEQSDKAIKNLNDIIRKKHDILVQIDPNSVTEIEKTLQGLWQSTSYNLPGAFDKIDSFAKNITNLSDALVKFATVTDKLTGRAMSADDFTVEAVKNTAFDLEKIDLDKWSKANKGNDADAFLLEYYNQLYDIANDKKSLEDSFKEKLVPFFDYWVKPAIDREIYWTDDIFNNLNKYSQEWKKHQDTNNNYQNIKNVGSIIHRTIDNLLASMTDKHLPAWEEIQLALDKYYEQFDPDKLKEKFKSDAKYDPKRKIEPYINNESMYAVPFVEQKTEASQDIDTLIQRLTDLPPTKRVQLIMNYDYDDVQSIEKLLSTLYKADKKESYNIAVNLTSPNGTAILDSLDALSSGDFFKGGLTATKDDLNELRNIHQKLMSLNKELSNTNLDKYNDILPQFGDDNALLANNFYGDNDIEKAFKIKSASLKKAITEYLNILSVKDVDEGAIQAAQKKITSMLLATPTDTAKETQKVRDLFKKIATDFTNFKPVEDLSAGFEKMLVEAVQIKDASAIEDKVNDLKNELQAKFQSVFGEDKISSEVYQNLLRSADFDKVMQGVIDKDVEIPVEFIFNPPIETVKEMLLALSKIRPAIVADIDIQDEDKDIKLNLPTLSLEDINKLQLEIRNIEEKSHIIPFKAKTDMDSFNHVRNEISSAENISPIVTIHFKTSPTVLELQKRIDSLHGKDVVVTFNGESLKEFKGTIRELNSVENNLDTAINPGDIVVETLEEQEERLQGIKNLYSEIHAYIQQIDEEYRSLDKNLLYEGNIPDRLLPKYDEAGNLLPSKGNYTQKQINELSNMVSDTTIDNFVKKVSKEQGRFEGKNLDKLVAMYLAHQEDLPEKAAENVIGLRDGLYVQLAQLDDAVKNIDRASGIYDSLIEKLTEVANQHYTVQDLLQKIQESSEGNITLANPMASASDLLSSINQVMGIDLNADVDDFANQALKAFPKIKKVTEEVVAEVEAMTEAESKAVDQAIEKKIGGSKNPKRTGKNVDKVITLGIDVVPPIDELTQRLNNVDTSLEGLGNRRIPQLATSFKEVADSIAEQSKLIHNSIVKINVAAIEARSALKDIGLTKFDPNDDSYVRHLEAYKKDLKHLDTEYKKLEKQKDSVAKIVQQAKQQGLAEAEAESKAIRDKANKIAENTLKEASAKAMKMSKEQLAEVKKAEQAVAQKEIKIAKEKEKLAASNTSYGTFAKQKELLINAAKKTKSFSLDEGSIVQLENKAMQFQGVLEKANGTLVKIKQNYTSLDQLLTKTGSFKLKGLTPEPPLMIEKKVTEKEQEKVLSAHQGQVVDNTVDHINDQTETVVQAASDAIYTQILNGIKATNKKANADVVSMVQDSYIKSVDGIITMAMNINDYKNGQSKLNYQFSTLNGAFNKDGSFKKEFLKSGLTDEKLEKQRAEQEAREAFLKMLQETIAMPDHDDDDELAKRTKEMLRQVAQVYEARVTEGADQRSRTFTDDDLLRYKEIFKEQIQKAQKEGRLDNFDLDDINIGQNLVKVMTQTKDTIGNLSIIRREYANILDLFNGTDLNIDALKYGASFVADASYNNEHSIEVAKKELLELIKEARYYGETHNTDDEITKAQKIAEYDEKRRVAYQNLLQLMEQAGLSSSKRQAIEQEITLATEDQLKTYKALNEDQKGKLDKLLGQFDQLFGSGIGHKNLNNVYLDSLVEFEGQTVELIPHLQNLRNEITKLFDDLNDPTKFKNKGAVGDHLIKLKRLLGQAASLTKTNLLNEDIITEHLNVDSNDYDSITKVIKKLYADKYGSKGLSISPYDPEAGSTVKYVENGLIKQQVVHLHEYQKAGKKVAQSNKEMTLSNTKAEQSFEQIDRSADQATSAVTQFALKGKQVKVVGTYVSSVSKLWNSFKGKMANLTQYISGIEIVMRAWNEIQQGFQFVKELDKVMTTVYQTMDITRQGLNELSSGAIDQARALGAASEQVVDAIGIYAAYGETVDSILRKTKPTTMLANAAGIDAKTASDQIQGVLQQYKELEGQEMRIVNSYEKIAANIQLDFDKGIQAIAEGVQVAGSVARSAGLDFEQYAASISKVAEISRMEGSAIGNAYKTILARTSRSKVPGEDVEPDDRGNAAAALAEIGINVYDQNGEYQDFGKTLDQLAAKWDTLSDSMRANIAESMAGVRNINIMQNIIETWEEAKLLAGEAMEDTGYAQEVQAKHMESMTAKLNTLRASIQDFWHSVLDTGVINTGIDVLSGLIHAAEGIATCFTAAGDAASFVADKLFDISDNASNTTKVITSLTTAIIGLTTAYAAFNKMREANTIKEGISNLGYSVKHGAGQMFKKETYTNFFNGLKQAAKTGHELGGSKASLKDIFGATKGGVNGIAAGFGAIAGKIGISTKALAAFGVAGLGVGAVALAVDGLTQSSEEAARAVEELKNKYKESQKVLKHNKKTIEEITPEFKELSQGIAADGITNQSLTNDEYQRYLDICNKIAEMYPSLVKGYDSQYNAILNLKDGMASVNDEYERQLRNASSERLKDGGDALLTNFQNKTSNRRGATELVDGFFDATSSIFGWGHAEVGKWITASEASQALEKALSMSYKDVIADLTANSLSSGKSVFGQKGYSYLTGNGINLSANMSEDEWKQARVVMRSNFDEIKVELGDVTADAKSYMQDYINVLTLGDDALYKNLDNESLKHISSLINNMSFDFIDGLQKSGKDLKVAIKDLWDNLLSKMTDGSQSSKIIQDIFNLDGSDSFDELSKLINNDIEILAESLGKNKIDIIELFGLEDEDKFVKSVESLLTTVNAAEKKAIENSMHAIQQDAKPAMDHLQRLRLHALNNPDANLDKIEVKQFNAEDGRTLVLTPILPNGEVLDDETLKDYADQIFAGKTDKEIKSLQLSMFDKKTNKKEVADFKKNINKIAKDYRKLGRNIDDIQDYLRDNNIATADEIELLTKCVEETDSWTEALNRFNIESINLEKNQEILDGLRKNIENVKEDISELSDAVEGSVSSMGMTSEQINKVVDAFDSLPDSAEFEYDKLFESTASGVHLNVQEMERLNGEYLKMQQGKYDDMLTKLQQQYRDTCVAITATTGAERNRHIATKEGLAEDIREIMELQSQFEGATSAVTNFFRAQSTTNEGSNYEKITKSIEDIENLYNEGLIGTDDFKSAVQMMTNEDLTGADSAKYLEVYQDKIDNLKRYFAEGQEGVRSFLDTLAGKGFASVDDKGIWSIDADIEEMAESLGLSQSLITEIFKRLNDYGFAIDFREESEYLKEFRLEAEKARATLDKKFQLNWEDADSKEKLNALIDKSDELRDELVRTFGGGSGQVKAFDQTVEYATAKLGEMENKVADVGSATGIADLNADLEKLHKLGKTDITINWENGDAEYWTIKINSLTDAINKMSGTDGKVSMDTEGAQEALRLYDAMLQKQQEITRPILLQVDSSALNSDLQYGMKAAIDLQDAISTLNRQTELAKVFNIDTSKAQEQVIKLATQLKDDSPTMYAALKLDDAMLTAENGAIKIQEKLNELTPEILVDAGFNPESLAKVEGYTPPVKEVEYGVNHDAVDSYKPEDKQATVQYKPDYGLVHITAPPTKTGTVKYTGDYSGVKAPSNSFLTHYGRGYADGTNGAPKDETALVGELGEEILVRDGKFHVLGENGAEFVDIKKNDIIFNAQQSKELLTKGKVTSGGGRGRAFVDGTIGKLNSLFKVKSGTAYAKGSYVTNGAFHSNNKFYNGNYQSKAGKGADEFLETFDWIEIKIDRIERAIQHLDTIANSVYKTFTKRNTALVQEFNKVQEEIALQEAATRAYQDAANKIGLTEEYARKVREGKLEIESITDETLSKQINEYRDLYEKSLDCIDAVIELKEQLSELAKTKFDNVVTEYEGQLAFIENHIGALETQLDLVEARGHFAGKAYYDALINVEKANMDKLQHEYLALQKEFNEAVATGTIDAESEAFVEMQQQIEEVGSAWQEAQLQLQEYQNQMREMDWSIFDRLIEQVEQVNSESEFLIELLRFNESELFDKKTGQFTDRADAIGGLIAVRYNTYMAKAEEYKKKISDIDKELANDPYNTILLDKKQEYIEAQRESILNANQEKIAIKDLIADSYEKMLEILQKLIDKRKELLQAQKD